MSPSTPAAPVVSVVMGVYNVAPFVKAAVRSALTQTLEDIEVIVVDDGSSDSTVQVVREISDPRLRLIENEHRGASATLNTGVAAARAPYVAFLDGDDVWLPERLRRHLEFMDARPEADLTFSLSKMIDENSVDMGITSRPANGPVNFESMLVDNRIGNGSAVMVRTAQLRAVGPFDENLAGAYDLDVWLRLALQRESCIFCIPEVHTCYRRRRGQITRNWQLMAGNCLKVLDRYRVNYPQRVARVESKAHCNLYRYFAAIAAENADARSGAQLLSQSFRANPLLWLATPRSYLVAAAVLAAAVLPSGVRMQLEQATRNIWRRMERAA